MYTCSLYVLMTAKHRCISVLFGTSIYSCIIKGSPVVCELFKNMQLSMFSVWYGTFSSTIWTLRELSVYRKLSILVAMVTNCDLISYLQGYPSYTMLLTLKSYILLLFCNRQTLAFSQTNIFSQII